MEYNKIPVTFHKRRRTTTEEINYVYDIKQVLVISGIEGLPETFRVDFCNEGDEKTKPMLGSNGSVEIPDEYLQTGKLVKAYIVLSGTEGDVETRYEIDIPVRFRPPDSGETPTPEEQSIIDQLIAALNEGVESAEQSAEDAEAWAKGTRGGEAVTEEDETFENNASYYASKAEASAEAAAGSAKEAGTSAEKAANAKTAAETAQGKAETAKQTAETAKDGAVAAKDQAQRIVDGAASAIDQAKTAAVNTVTSAGDSQITRIGGAGTEAVSAVGSARTAAVSAVNDAGRTQVTAVQEEGARQKAAAKEQADAAAGSAREAGTARDGAVAAKTAVENLSVTAESIDPESSASVQKTLVDGIVHLLFGIPRGMKGEKGDPPSIEEYAGLVTAWLDEHITQPTTPIVDPSLNIEGAAADAAATGLIKAVVNGIAMEDTALITLERETEFTFWLGRAFKVLDDLTDDLVAAVAAEIAKLPQDENGQAIVESIAEGNSWIQQLLHEVEGTV